MDYLLQNLLFFLLLIQTFSVRHKQTRVATKGSLGPYKGMYSSVGMNGITDQDSLIFLLTAYQQLFYIHSATTWKNTSEYSSLPPMGTSLNHLFPSYTNWCQVYTHEGGEELVWTSFLHQCKYKLSHFLHMRTAGTSNSAMSWAGWMESCLLYSLILFLEAQ